MAAWKYSANAVTLLHPSRARGWHGDPHHSEEAHVTAGLWTLKKRLRPAHGQEQLAHEPPLGKGMSSSAESFSGPCIPSLPRLRGTLAGAAIPVAPLDPCAPSQRSTWSSSGSPSSGLQPQRFCTQFRDHATTLHQLVPSPQIGWRSLTSLSKGT